MLCEFSLLRGALRAVAPYTEDLRDVEVPWAGGMYREIIAEIIPHCNFDSDRANGKLCTRNSSEPRATVLSWSFGSMRMLALIPVDIEAGNEHKAYVR